jgi:hypothetical protein
VRSWPTAAGSSIGFVTRSGKGNGAGEEMAAPTALRPSLESAAEFRDCRLDRLTVKPRANYSHTGITSLDLDVPSARFKHDHVAAKHP